MSRIVEDATATVSTHGVRPRKAWTLAHYLAALAAVFLFWEAWTLISWLADGPSQVTQFRNHHDASWWVARAYEGSAIVLAIVLGTIVVRRCLRERRLTFDAMLCIAGALTYWTDPTANFIQPLFMYSSNLVNVRNWCGHMPFVINPDCGRLPEPILMDGIIYTFGLLLFAMVVNAGMRWIRARRPSISTGKLIALAMLGGIVVDFLLEIPMYRLHIATYVGAPDGFALWGHSGHKYPMVEALWAGVIVMGIALVRYSRDDAGRTIVERGLERHRPRVRTAVSLLALTAIVHILCFVGNGGTVALGFFSSPYKKLPSYIVNDMCDAPGIRGTRYGPCPGSPGYRAPLRGSLPGSSP